MILSGGFQAQGSRKEQQDSFALFESKDISFKKHAGVLALVADGMGGLAQGKEASELAINAFIKAYKTKTQTERVETALLRSVHECNEEVFQFAESQGMEEKIGTTIVAAVFKGNELYWISVGDSRIYLIQRQEITLLTSDHNYLARLQELVAEGEMTEEEALKNPQRGALTSFIGSERISKIGRNSSPIKCFDTDQVLLCSDGLYSKLSEKDLISSLQLPPSESSKNLIEKKLQLKSKNQDNLTAAVLQISSESQITTKTASKNKYAVITAVGLIGLFSLFLFLKPLDSEQISVYFEDQAQNTTAEEVAAPALVERNVNEGTVAIEDTRSSEELKESTVLDDEIKKEDTIAQTEISIVKQEIVDNDKTENKIQQKEKEPVEQKKTISLQEEIEVSKADKEIVKDNPKKEEKLEANISFQEQRAELAEKVEIKEEKVVEEITPEKEEEECFEEVSTGIGTITMPCKKEKRFIGKKEDVQKVECNKPGENYKGEDSELLKPCPDEVEIKVNF